MIMKHVVWIMCVWLFTIVACSFVSLCLVMKSLLLKIRI